ncbi:MAG: PA14 domain-containing protein [Chloroflexota bacterium]|nr:PA14 domain-containing protein [Chloroflexota bacterium]
MPETLTPSPTVKPDDALATPTLDLTPTFPAMPGNEILFRALAPAPSPLPGMNNWIYYTSRLTGPWLTTNITNSNTQYGPIKPDYSPSGTQVVAWYDTGIFMGNIPTQAGQFMWFAPNPIPNTNYNTNNPDWHISNPPPQLAPGTGLLGTYYNGITLSAPVGNRLDPVVDFNFAANPSLITTVGVPQSNLHNFSARWRGFVTVPVTGNYRFVAGGDDGVRLFINGAYVLNDNPPPGQPVPWSIHGYYEFESVTTFNMVAGQLYPIEMQYYSGAFSQAAATLKWVLPGQTARVIIPQQYLYPPEPPQFCPIPGNGLPPASGAFTTTLGVGQGDGSPMNLYVDIFNSPTEGVDGNPTQRMFGGDGTNYVGVNEQVSIRVLGRYAVRDSGGSIVYWYRVSYWPAGGSEPQPPTIGWIPRGNAAIPSGMEHILANAGCAWTGNLNTLPEQDRDGATVYTLPYPQGKETLRMLYAPIIGNISFYELAPLNDRILRIREYADNPAVLGGGRFANVVWRVAETDVRTGWILPSDPQTRQAITDASNMLGQSGNRTSTYGQPFQTAHQSFLWPTNPNLPTFTRYPISIDSTCDSTQSSINGLGIPFNPSIYGDPGFHLGTDFFAPDNSPVFSIGGNGLVVGIGVGRTAVAGGRIDPDTTVVGSAHGWGSAGIELGVRGYSVIVRHGHLFVLYGHLRSLSNSVFVGAILDAGTPIGTIGVYDIPHVHIEINNFEFVVPPGSLQLSPMGQFGFVSSQTTGATRPQQRYDVAQFFATNTTAYIDDGALGSGSVEGLGRTIANNGAVDFKIGSVISCTRIFNVSQSPAMPSVFDTIANADIRGFESLESSPIAPIPPSTIPTLP